MRAAGAARDSPDTHGRQGQGAFAFGFLLRRLAGWSIDLRFAAVGPKHAQESLSQLIERSPKLLSGYVIRTW